MTKLKKITSNALNILFKISFISYLLLAISTIYVIVQMVDHSFLIAEEGIFLLKYGLDSLFIGIMSEEICQSFLTLPLLICAGYQLLYTIFVIIKTRKTDKNKSAFQVTIIISIITGLIILYCSLVGSMIHFGPTITYLNTANNWTGTEWQELFWSFSSTDWIFYVISYVILIACFVYQALYHILLKKRGTINITMQNKYALPMRKLILTFIPYMLIIPYAFYMMSIDKPYRNFGSGLLISVVNYTLIIPVLPAFIIYHIIYFALQIRLKRKSEAENNAAQFAKKKRTEKKVLICVLLIALVTAPIYPIYKSTGFAFNLLNADITELVICTSDRKDYFEDDPNIVKLYNLKQSHLNKILKFQKLQKITIAVSDVPDLSVFNELP